MFKIFSNVSKALLERPAILSEGIQANFCTSVCRSSKILSHSRFNISRISQHFLGIRYNSDEKGVVTTTDLKTTNSSGVGMPVKEEAEKITPEAAAAETYYKTKSKFQILQMDESDIEGTSIGKQGIPLAVVHGMKPSRIFRNDEDDDGYNRTDRIAFLSQDIDLRRESIQRWWKGLREKYEIKIQKYSPARHNTLGPDLACAHFFVFRRGKIKFLAQPNWVTEYRTDMASHENDEDLPSIRPEVCTLPTKYEPDYFVEAVDCSDMTELRYEGLENFKGLNYCKSLKFENCVHLDAWCMDRLASYFSDRLVYLDITGCTGLTEGALCAISRFKNLKTLIVRDLPQIRNKDLVCAWLEEMNPELEIIGTSYEEKLEELQTENERMNKKLLEEEAATITVESTDATPESQIEHKRQ